MCPDKSVNARESFAEIDYLLLKTASKVEHGRRKKINCVSCSLYTVRNKEVCVTKRDEWVRNTLELLR